MTPDERIELAMMLERLRTVEERTLRLANDFVETRHDLKQALEAIKTMSHGVELLLRARYRDPEPKEVPT